MRQNEIQQRRSPKREQTTRRSSLLDLTTRIGQEHVRILNRKGKEKKGGRKREYGTDATRTEKNRLVTDERTSRAHKRCLEGSGSSSSREKSRDRFSGIRVDVRNWRIATKSNEKQKLVSQFNKLPQHLGWQMSWKKWIND